MQKYQNVVQTSQGVAVAGASVTVQTYPGGVAATIYSDNGSTVAANPLTTDTYGNFSFYAADGRYQLIVNGDNIPTDFTYTDILLEDPADPNSYVLSAGSFGSPALSFTGDSDNGIWSPAANVLGITKQTLIGVTSANATGGVLQLSGGITFPATQVSASDPNTLDDYEEGSWTPVLSFDTVGNLSVTYTTQLGWYTKIGNTVTVWFNVLTSAFTHTTSAGNLRLTSLPFTASADASGFYYGTLSWQGITKAGYTQIVPRVTPSDSQVYFIASGSAQAVSAVAFGDVPTGGTVLIRGALQYRV